MQPITRSRLWLVTGIATLVMAPAATASYDSLNSIVGPSESGGYSSLTSITADPGGPPASDPYGTVNSLVGAIEPLAVPPAEVTASGFDWGDALIGALAAVALVFLAGAAARFVGRSRHSSAESHA